MAGAFADGATEAGADVVLIGLASTDQLYFASGHLGHPGAMFTASHNPAQYNGIKMCRAERPADRHGDRARRDPRRWSPRAGRRGRAAGHDHRATTCSRRTPPTCSTLAPVAGRRLKVVVDAGNGMAGHTAPAVFGRLGDDQVELVPMYFELDGTFPNHEANPIEPDEPRRPAEAGRSPRAPTSGWPSTATPTAASSSTSAGAAVSPSTLTALIAARELAKEPGATVIHNLITSRAVPEIVTELGGTPVRTRVGHSYIKATMAETDAIFGGEHSGHFYFRDFWRADSGMLAALHALAALAETDRPLSELLADYERYVVSGEINSTSPTRRRSIGRARGDVRRPRRRHHRPARRAHRQPRRLVVQRPAVQHRAAAAAQRRGSRPGHDGRGPRRRARRSSGGPMTPMNLDPALLDDHRLPGLPRRARARPARSWSAPAAAWPTRSATTSRCCSSTRPASRPEAETMATWFDESRLDDEAVLARADARAAAARRVRRPGPPRGRSTPRRRPPRRSPAARTRPGRAR